MNPTFGHPTLAPFGRSFGRVSCMKGSKPLFGILVVVYSLFARLSSGDPYYPLCQHEEETTAHIFFHCQATKMFWFGICWGFRPDLIPISSDLVIVKVVVDPPICFAPSNESNAIFFHASCQIALALECIWQLCNQVVH